MSVIPKRNRRHLMKDRTGLHKTNTEEKLVASLGGGGGTSRFVGINHGRSEKKGIQIVIKETQNPEHRGSRNSRLYSSV
jgi:hypothetical protein